MNVHKLGNEDNPANNDDTKQLSDTLNSTTQFPKKTVRISGQMLGIGRSETMLRRAFEVISAQNPDIDWSKNDLLLTIVPSNEVL